MNFGFSVEQEMLRDAARRFLETECPPTVVRTMMADATAHSTDLWRKIAAQGWLGVLVPEELGGIAGNYLDLTVLLEEMGKVLLPGPFFASVLLGSTALLAGGSPEQKRALLPALCAGDLIITLALAEQSGSFDAAGVGMSAKKKGRNFILSGEKLFVPDAHVADRLVVVARTAKSKQPEGGITAFLVDAHAPGVTIEQLKTVDMTRRLCRVNFDNVAVAAADIVGTANEGWPIAQRVLDQAGVGLSVELVGTAQRALDLSVQYAKERVQFGKPIGSFQAVKHKCVDMMIMVENARSLCYYAAWAISEDAPEARQAVPMAKAYCSDMGRTVGSEAIQVHGGIGFTWEHDMHLYYRRAIAGEANFGNAPVHRESVAQQIGA